MSIVRSIEVIAQSQNGFDDACRQAIREASHTVRGNPVVLDQERRVHRRR